MVRILVSFIGVIAGIYCAVSAAHSTTPGMIILVPVGIILAGVNFGGMLRAAEDL